MKPSSELQKRARKGKSCIFTSLKTPCGHAEMVEVAGFEFRLCPLHKHNLNLVIAEAEQRDRKVRRLARLEDAA